MSERPTAVRYRVLTWLTVAAALAYLCRNAVGVAESTIREDLGLTLEQSGVFMGAFFWTYAIFQVPGGWLAHRRGTRIAMTAFVLMGALATLALGIVAGVVAWVWDDLIALLGGLAFGTFAAALAPVVGVGLAWRRVSARIAAASIATGIVVHLGLEAWGRIPDVPRLLAPGASAAAVALAGSFLVLVLGAALFPAAAPDRPRGA